MHTAGIFSFSQIAAMTAQDLRNAVAAEAFMKVESWIDQARELAGK